MSNEEEWKRKEEDHKAWQQRAWEEDERRRKIEKMCEDLAQLIATTDCMPSTWHVSTLQVLSLHRIANALEHISSRSFR